MPKIHECVSAPPFKFLWCIFSADPVFISWFNYEKIILFIFLQHRKNKRICRRHVDPWKNKHLNAFFYLTIIIISNWKKKKEKKSIRKKKKYYNIPHKKIIAAAYKTNIILLFIAVIIIRFIMSIKRRMI